MSDAPDPTDRRALLKEALAAVEQMQAKLDAERRRASEPIAIVGMACRFPGGAVTPEAYWTLLQDGVDAVGEVPETRWDAGARARLARASDGKALVHYAGLLEGLDRFDPKFFGISPREATTMDPQQRLVLEVVWEALERAGQAPDRLTGSATGVFIGITTGDYADLVKAAGPAALDVYMATGNAHNAAAGRVSYVLGLNGPAMAVDTACSSSLVAVHLACQSLRIGESRLALAGGVNVILTPDPFVVFSRWGMMAPDGRCKTFDERADGFVRSEGCGIVALKRLSDAQSDGDEILAVIRGSAVNQDGASSGLTVPNGLAQQAVIRQALRVAGVEPADVAYVEAHGTGTALGDPIELEALDAALGTGRPADRPLVVGSVKTNLGHLESASGVAGLMKVVLALQHREIPPHLHFGALTPRVSLRGAVPIVPTTSVPWPPGGPCIAGVSSFGFSGTNAHVVLEAAPPRPAVAGAVTERPVHVLALSARSEAALGELADRYAERLETMADEQLADVCFTAATGRARFAHRLAVPAATVEQARTALRQARRAPGPRPGRGGRPRVAFLFSGQGSQRVGMGRQLYDTCPTFRRALDRCAAGLRGEMDRPLLDVMYPAPGQDSPLDQTAYTQPALFSLEYALAETWREWGIVPSAVLGHSVGEYVAACVAGAMSLEDALALIAARGRLMQALPPGGAMAAVLAGQPEVAAALRGRERTLAIAAVNAADNVVISGSAAALEEVLADLAARGLRSRRLNVSHAFHSPLMDPVLDDFAAAVKRVTLSAPRIGLVSNVTGRFVTAEEITTPTYWRRHLRDAVLFAAGVEALRAEGIEAFVEIGPTPTLLGLARRGVAGEAAVWLPSLRHGQEDWRQMLESLGALHVAGADVDWAAFDRPYARRRVVLPTYPFQRERYWVEPGAAEPISRELEGESSRAGHPFAGRRMTSPRLSGAAFECPVRSDHPSFLADHTIHGTVVVPGTAYLEVVRVAAGEILGSADLDLEQVTIRQPMVLEPGAGRVVQVIVAPPAASAVSVEVFSRPAGAGQPEDWQLHATARVGHRSAAACEHTGDSLAAARERCADPIPTTTFYERLAAIGLDYGPTFRGVTELWRGPAEAVGRIEVDAARLPGLAAYQAHPALLDACLHLFGAVLAADETAAGDVYVPVEVERFRLLRPLGARILARASVRRPSRDGSLVGDLHVFDDAGTLLACVGGVSLRRLPRVALGRAVSAGWLYGVAWRPKALEPPAIGAPPRSAHWIVLADRGGVGAALARQLEAAGARCDVILARDVDSSSADGLAFLWSRPTPDRDGVGVVHLWGLDAPSLDDPSACLPDIQRQGTGSALHVAQAIVRARANGRLVLVTRGAQRVGAETATAPAQAPLWGLGRVIRGEHPELRCVCVDLDPVADPSDPSALATELLHPDGEDEVALRATGRWVARLVPFRAGGPDRAADQAAMGGPVRLEIGERGVLDNLRWAPVDRPAPGPGQVEIQVHASGLNFRDVLNTLGMYPGDAGGLGSECAGLVVRVGSGVESVRVGDPVIALTNPAFATFVTADAALVVRKPAAMTMEEGATIPIAFMTAAYALREIARVQPGERVLVHAAAGGVGLAAVQVARRAGAEIFATAGSPSKREYLASLGVRHVMDSRSPDFADQVMERTGGEGVDVVVNSLTGEFIPAGLRVLRAGGRFIEIGKRGVWDAGRVSHEYPGVAYHVLYLGEICERDPRRAGEALRGLVAEVAAGGLAPLPQRTFVAAEAVDAFRYMAQARHIGKVVITAASAPAASAPPIRGDATYLVTGGLGALGLEVARWLHEEGARHLVLMARGEPSTAAREAIRALEAQGTTIRVARGDVAREGDVRRILDEVAGSLPPIRGVVHAAGVLDDGVLAQQTWSRFERVMAPKVMGAWNLHRLTQELPLDLFVLFSSASALLGAPGQASYVAANCFLDALAHHRRARGRPALSIDWGPWAGAGMAARDMQRGARGVRWIAPDHGRALLASVVREDLAQVAVLSADWAALAAAAPGTAARPFLADLVRGGDRVPVEVSDRTTGGSSRSGLLAAAGGERERLMGEILRGHFAAVLQTTVAELEMDDSLSRLGTDSLMAVELKNRIEADTGISIPVTDLLEAPRLGELAAALCRRLEESDGTVGPSASDAARPPESNGEDVQSDAAHPMSHGQQALWFLHHLAPESAAYNVLFAAYLRSPVDAAALQTALRSLVARHAALRTTFGVEDGRPVQRIHRECAVSLERVDATGTTSPALRRMVAESAYRAFDLANGPVLRATVFTRGVGESVLLLTVHHIAIDGWSFQILFQELGRLYAEATTGTPAALAPLPYCYRDFVRWQDQALAGPPGERARGHWLAELGGDLPVLALRTDRPRPPRPRFRGASVVFALSEAVSRELKELAASEKATTYMILLAAYQVLLHRETGQNDILVGSPAAGRTRQEFSAVVGYFVNTVVVRGTLAGDPTFRGFLAAVRDKVRRAVDHQDYPFPLLVKQLGVKREGGRSPVFQTLFNFIPAPQAFDLSRLFVPDHPSGPVRVGGLVMEPFPLPQQEGQFELELEMSESGGVLGGRFKFDTDLFEERSIVRLRRTFETLLETIVSSPDRPLSWIVSRPELSSAEDDRVQSQAREEIDL